MQRLQIQSLMVLLTDCAVFCVSYVLGFGEKQSLCGKVTDMEVTISALDKNKCKELPSRWGSLSWTTACKPFVCFLD